MSNDDTVGRVARYMGWVKEKKGDPDVKGIIIAAEPDKRLEFALKVVPNVQLLLYKVDFELSEFKSS